MGSQVPLTGVTVLMVSQERMPEDLPWAYRRMGHHNATTPLLLKYEKMHPAHVGECNVNVPGFRSSSSNGFEAVCLHATRNRLVRCVPTVQVVDRRIKLNTQC